MVRFRRRGRGLYRCCRRFGFLVGRGVASGARRGWSSLRRPGRSVNGARLVACHDDMGQVRLSTGQLDDLKTAYDDDGVHLTIARVDRLAVHWQAALEAWY